MEETITSAAIIEEDDNNAFNEVYVWGGTEFIIN